MVLRWVGRITDELIGRYSSLKWGYGTVSELKGGSPSLVLEDQGWRRGVEEKVKSLSQAFRNNTWGLKKREHGKSVVYCGWSRKEEEARNSER